jgi:prophage antirepressor-like protein
MYVINTIKGGKSIMNELQIFKNEEFGEIRSLEINNEPYFVGKEIATILGYKNGSRDVSRHVEEEDRAVVPIRYFRSKQRYNNDK